MQVGSQASRSVLSSLIYRSIGLSTTRPIGLWVCGSVCLSLYFYILNKTGRLSKKSVST